ncbi:unnamed protein product [Caenorhabditis angaria]|uniref:Peptidase S1 domain-containing protein n=1 Tax=Caenorhabditis angaria TaxID=860376 RepID=A0A9P1I7G7_9PELO|nr:unnamed protein product [Caenorhabditis angaria]
MKTVIFLCSYLFIKGIACYILTKQENEALAQICGLYGREMGGQVPRIERKVLRGKNADIKDAPWSVAIKVAKLGNRHRHSICTGTLISPWHVLTARHCFMQETEDGLSWVNDDAPIDWRMCKKRDYFVPQKVLKQTQIVFETTCGTKKACKAYRIPLPKVKRRAKSIVLLDICPFQRWHFAPPDVAIIELAEEIKFNEKAHPVCLLNNETLVDEDSLIQLFGYGDDPSLGKGTKGRLRYELSRKEEHKDHGDRWVVTHSISKKNLACRGDSGAGSIVKINNRFTIHGVLSRGDPCESATLSSTDHLSSVAFLVDRICEYTGICQIEYSTNHTTKGFYDENSGKSQIFHPFLFLPIVFLFKILNFQ